LAAMHIFGQYDFNRAPVAPREQGLLLMKHQEEEDLGLHMGKMAGTLDQHWNITDVTRFTLRKQDQTE
jgi:hypothetical protein